MPTFPRYFCGQTLTGPVSVSPANTFSDLVEKLNVCPTLPFSRKAFFALPERQRNKAKRVPYFVPAVFQTSPSERVKEQATHCNLLALDIDPEKEYKDGKWQETGRYPAAPFVKNPNLLYEAIPFNFIAHLTASSTFERPRLRVMVDCEAIPVHLYPQAVESIAKLLGLPSITKESKVATQPMFLAVQFQDDTEETHPVIATRTDGPTFQVSDISGQPSEYRNGANGHTNGSNGSMGNPMDGLEFLRAPLPEITLAIAKEALAHISPDLDYHSWLEVAASLKHQFAHTEEEEAYELFDEWSAGSESKYASPEETRAKWNSLRPTPVGREPRTIRSLLHLAAQNGWDDQRVKERAAASFNAWMDQATTATALLEQGIRKILLTPQLSSTQEGVLLDQLRLKARERFQYRASLTDLRKDLQSLRDRAKAQIAQPDEKEKKRCPSWAYGLSFVSTPKEFYRPLTGEKYTPDSFDLKYGRCLLHTPKSLALAGLPITETNLCRPTVEPSKYVLNFLQIPVFYDYAYCPSQPNEMVFVHEKRKYVNTYAPTYPEPDYERASEAGTLFQQHLSNLIKEPEYRQTLIDFMAYQVQFPGQKVRWAVLIQGTEGAGKTYLAEVMKAVLGRRHVKMVDGTLISSGWSEWTFGYQLAVIEEVRVVGSSRHDIMNRLKPWITNDDIPINEKFRSSRDAINITNYMLFSNHHDALALSAGDRRYFVLKSPLQRKEQVLALGKDYFPQLFNFLNAHPGAMRAFFLNWKISDDFSPNAQAPRTTYVTEMVADSASDLTAAVRRIIGEADHPLIQYDMVSAKALMDTLQIDEGMKNSHQQLAHVLREEGYTQVGRHLLGSERHYLWTRPGVTNPADEAARRVKLDCRRMGMELLFS